jgi:hypothetical protein
MARVFITGSADGLGQMAARLLVASGHEVALHARNRERARHAIEAVPGAQDALVGDLSSVAETLALAEQANAAGPFDAVIHNAGVGLRKSRTETVDGLEHVFAVNVLAPYLLTALIERPRRLIYISSGMHIGGDPDLTDLQWRSRPWDGAQAYSDSKLFDFGRRRCPMQSILAGSPPRWAGLEPPTISLKGQRHKYGWPSATTRAPWSAAATSTTCRPGTPTRRLRMSAFRRDCCALANKSAASSYLFDAPDLLPARNVFHPSDLVRLHSHKQFARPAVPPAVSFSLIGAHISPGYPRSPVF